MCCRCGQKTRAGRWRTKLLPILRVREIMEAAIPARLPVESRARPLEWEAGHAWIEAGKRMVGRKRTICKARVGTDRLTCGGGGQGQGLPAD
jgi:hypothetical protein